MTCCFFGHRKIENIDNLKPELARIVEDLITSNGFDTFLFGSRSEFNSLCYETVSKLKEKHPHIKRVYVRGEYADIDDKYKDHLSKSFEETYFPERARGAGRLSYIVRNREMISKSQLCVIYYNETYCPPIKKNAGGLLPKHSATRSGTHLAYEYARRKNKKFINLFK